MVVKMKVWGYYGECKPDRVSLIWFLVSDPTAELVGTAYAEESWSRMSKAFLGQLLWLTRIMGNGQPTVQENECTDVNFGYIYYYLFISNKLGSVFFFPNIL